MSKLPAELITLIYRACCGTCTPEQAQKEPCLCDAAAIVEQIEEWHEAEVEAGRDDE